MLVVLPSCTLLCIHERVLVCVYEALCCRFVLVQYWCRLILGSDNESMKKFGLLHSQGMTPPGIAFEIVGTLSTLS